MKKTAAKSPAKPKRRKPGPQTSVDRILVGVRMEPKLVKVMKGLAELQDCALGELVERVFWHALEGNSVFADRGGKLASEMRHRIQSLKSVYGVNYSLEDLAKPK